MIVPFYFYNVFLPSSNEGKWRKMKENEFTYLYTSLLVKYFTIRKENEGKWIPLFIHKCIGEVLYSKEKETPSTPVHLVPGTSVHLVHPGTVIYVECINIPINRLQWGWPPQIGKLGAVSKILFSFFLFFSHIITFWLCWHFGIFSKLNIQAKAYISHPIICCSKNVENISFTLYCDRQQQCRCCWINRR